MYKKSELIFSDKNIITKDTNSEVMGSWEKPLMQTHVDLITEIGGNILEIGFGMGISASMIQEKNISSHTIVEIHPQVFEKASEWQKSKNNVTLLFGDWVDLKEIIISKKYDGIFFDTHLDDNRPLFRELIVERCIKPNGTFSYFNVGKMDVFDYKERLKYKIVDVEPDPKCTYFFGSKMFAPYIKY
jgi:spermidine synthase